MKIKKNTFYVITTYGAKLETAIESCFTNKDNNNNSNKILIYTWLQIKISLG